MSDLTVILPCAGEGTRLSLPYPKEVHSIEKNKSLIAVSYTHLTLPTTPYV